MTAPQKPHTLRAQPDECNYLSWSFECPYAHEEAPRPCQMGTEWTGPEPEECDGWDDPDYGHMHPDPQAGCGAQFMMGELGWEDGVVWDAKRIPSE